MNLPIKNLIWIASYPKSGNTWFRILIKNIFSQKNRSQQVEMKHGIPMASSRQIFDYYSGVHSSELSIDEIDNLRPKVYRHLSSEMNGISFLKVHDSWKVNSEGESLFPDEVTKGVIYLIRNPLDIAVSLSFHNSSPIAKAVNIINDENSYLSQNKDKLTLQIHQYLSNWSNHVISWVVKSNLPIHVIRYEDLLMDTKKSLIEALEFLKLEVDNELIIDSINKSDFNYLQEQEKKEGFHEKPLKSHAFFREGKSNIYMNYLSNRQIETIYSRNKAIMNRFGYYIESGN